MKKIVIVTESFLDPGTGKRTIGGIQTYMHDLSVTCIETGYDVQLCQFADAFTVERLEIDGIRCRFVTTKNKQASFDALYDELNSNETVFIIATDQMDIRSKAYNVIVIQHGIAFDIPGYMIPGFWGKTELLQSVNKLLRCVKNVRRMDYVRNTVCVDYNYYNWYKTLGTIRDDKNVWIIPNYSSEILTLPELESKLEKTGKTKKIVFARRFFDYRGSLLFAKVVKRLFDEDFDVDVTFAGDGPCKEQMKDITKGCNNVHFTSYLATESVRFHSDFDIAVVPTIYSEGTSLSLCEAMAAGCFPISTFVGGLSNILIDHYNGLLCSPTESSLYDAVVEAISMSREDYIGIVMNAYHSADKSFSLASWKERWIKVLEAEYKGMDKV